MHLCSKLESQYQLTLLYLRKRNFVKVQDLIKQRFTGTLNSEAEYIELIVQTFAVLILGLVLWRLMAMFHKKKKAQRKTSGYFDSEFSRNWKK